MRPQDAEKLLGGYATDTLTEAERKALFETALANQDLFNALAGEQALQELLSDPRCRRRLLGLLKPRKEPFYHRLAAWLKRPAPWALAGSVAATVLIMTAIIWLNRPAATLPPAAPAPVQIAQKVAPASPEVAPPPPPQLEKKKQRAPAAHPQPAPLREMQLAEKAETLATAPPAPADKPGLVAAVLPTPPAAPAETPKELALPSFQAQVAAAPKGVGFKAMAEQEAQRGVLTAPLAAQEPSKAPSSRGALDLRQAQTKAAGGAAPLQPLPGALGLRYTILKKGAGGQYSAVDPEAVFQPGDSIRLSVEANQAGYLSVLRQDPAGAWNLLHQVQIQPRIGQTIPSSGAIPLAGQPGQDRLLLVFSRSPQDEFQDLAQPNRKLIIQKVPSEAATYVVDAGPDPASRLRVQINLALR
jgi:hypothetical protein